MREFLMSIIQRSNAAGGSDKLKVKMKMVHV